MSPVLAEKIVDAILADLSDRRGIKQELGQISDEIYAEMRETLVALVQAHLDGER